MKFLYYFSLLLLIGGLTLGSCKKDEPSTPSANPPVIKSNEIKTTINGQAWSGAILSWAVSGGTRQLNANTTNSSIQIFMPEDTTGTFNALDNVITVSYNDGTTTWSNNISGQVKITANSNDHVEGEFEVTLTSYFSNPDTLKLTSGTFYFKDL
jgi:hypothetical protein